jgi:hypothetical protein
VAERKTKFTVRLLLVELFAIFNGEFSCFCFCLLGFEVCFFHELKIAALSRNRVFFSAPVYLTARVQ